MAWVQRVKGGLFRSPPSIRPLGTPRPLSRCRAASLSLALLAGLVGCRQPLPVLTVPVSNWPGYEYLYLAAQKGLAAAEGLTLRSLEFADPQAIVHAYLRGELPVAQLTTVEAVDLCARAPERCPVVILVLDESRGADQLVARPGISTISQLRGQRVGVTRSTLGPFVLSRALARHGMGLRDVRLSPMPLDAMPSALASGAIDAAALFPPYTDQAARVAAARPLFDSRAIPGEIFDVLVVEPHAYRELSSTLPRLLRAWQAAQHLRQRRSAEAIALMAQREGLSPQEFRKAEQGLVYFNLRQQPVLLKPGGAVARNLRSVQQVQIELGLVRPGSALPGVSDAPLRAALHGAADGPSPPVTPSTAAAPAGAHGDRPDLHQRRRDRPLATER